MRQIDYHFIIEENSIKNISKRIANEVADRIYCEILFARYMPEILDIEKGSVVTIKTEDFQRNLKNRINSMIENNKKMIQH
jgi:hypothetical protein